MGFYIYYNLLNLPTVIYTEGDMGLYYTYLSDGTKIEVCGYDDNEPTRYAVLGSVSKSVSGQAPSDSSDMQI